MTELSLPFATPASLRPARLCSDAQLAQRAARGDRRAFEAIFERHHQAVYRYCRSILVSPEDAADALQNTMAAVLRSLEGETREIALKAWIFRIAHNESLSIVRRRRPQVELDDAQACPRPSLESDVLASERLRQLVADVQALPDRQRGALVMRELNDLGYDEIAAVFGVSEGAARQTVHEARTALHDLEQGRSMPCAEVRELIGERDGRMLRGRKVRSHLRACSSCEGFRVAIGERRTALGLAAPPLAAPFAASMLAGLLGGGQGGVAAGVAMTTASAAPLAGGAAITGMAAKVAATSAGAKAIAVLVAAATLTGGAVVAEHEISTAATGPAPARHAPAPARPESASARAGAATAAAATRRSAANGFTARASSASKARGRAKAKGAAAAQIKAAPGARRTAAARRRAAKQAAKARIRTKAKQRAARTQKKPASSTRAKQAPVVHAKPKSSPASSKRPAAASAPKAEQPQVKQPKAARQPVIPGTPAGG